MCMCIHVPLLALMHVAFRRPVLASCVEGLSYVLQQVLILHFSLAFEGVPLLQAGSCHASGQVAGRCRTVTHFLTEDGTTATSSSQNGLQNAGILEAGPGKGR